jgi:hypothetical protein
MGIFKSTKSNKQDMTILKGSFRSCEAVSKARFIVIADCEARSRKQSGILECTGLLRRFTPRNDGNRPFLDTTTGGLKARQSLAQGNALWHDSDCRSLSPERAQSGLFYLITPFQGLRNVMRSVRRALPCANDYRAFSPAFQISMNYQLSIINC